MRCGSVLSVVETATTKPPTHEDPNVQIRFHVYDPVSLRILDRAQFNAIGYLPPI